MKQNNVNPAFLFEQIKTIKNPPTDAVFEQILAQRSLITPMLLQELEAFADNLHHVASQGDDYIRHVISLYLLAYFKEQAAYPLIIRLISQPTERVVDLTGEVFTEALGRILASTFNGDITLIQQVIEHESISLWLRCGALDSLLVLWQQKQLTREFVIAYLMELVQGKLERKSSYVWDTVALLALDLSATELALHLKKALKQKLIDPIVLNELNLEQALSVNYNHVIQQQEQIVSGYIKSPIKELTWWLFPNEEGLDKGIDYAAMNVPLADKKIIAGERARPMGWRVETSRRAHKKLGRNEPCYCGSGKKFKKCCAFI